MSGEPYPKSEQLQHGRRRRYRRKVASPKQWQALRAEKIGPCRACCDPGTNGRLYGRITLHHVIPRGRGGDDLEDNLVPLCLDCHRSVEIRTPEPCRRMLAALTDAEYTYAVTKCGEDVFERCYGIEYDRG